MKKKILFAMALVSLLSCKEDFVTPPQEETPPQEDTTPPTEEDGDKDSSIPSYPLLPSFKYDPMKPDPREAPKELEDGKKLVWNDEFNDPQGTKPNDAKWVYENGFVRNKEAQYYTDNNACCDGEGNMVIEGRIEKVKNLKYDPSCKGGCGGNHWKHEKEYAEYTSASITTQGKYSFKYGELIVRAKIPTCMGAWPAIWTLGIKREWPANGELDVLEYYIHTGKPSILANACWASNQAWVGKWDSEIKRFTDFTGKDPEWNMKYHIWREVWDENFIRIYLDDELMNEIDLSKTINGNNGGIKDKEGKTGEGENPFRQEHYLLLNLALGSSGGALHNPSFPLHYHIDYVRIYQHQQ